MTLTDADKAYKRIKDRILTTEMQPGSVIRETDLMEELALGRTPIREGLQRLQAENLVIVKPRRGMFVADITITDLTQIYEVRVELEALCARLATIRITPDQLTQMRSLAEMYEEMDTEDKIKLIDVDRKFHELLGQATNNRFLSAELDNFYNLSLRIWYLALQYAQPEDIDVCAHMDILDAIEGKDPDKASRRMREHIELFHRQIRRYL